MTWKTETVTPVIPAHPGLYLRHPRTGRMRLVVAWALRDADSDAQPVFAPAGLDDPAGVVVMRAATNGWEVVR